MSYLLFDLDGTLTESGPGIKKCVQYALSHFGINETDENKLRLFIGPPLYDSFTKLYNLSHDDANKAVEFYRERYKTKGIFENSVYDGIEDLLKTLHQKGFTLAVASSKPEVFVKQILAHFNLDKYFTVITGATLDGKLSEKSDVIAKALLELNAIDKKDECLMIGDRNNDAQGAKDNGIECIGCLWGYGNFEELNKAGCNITVNTPKALLQLILNLCSK